MKREQMRALFQRALDGGASRISVFEAEWEVHGTCLQPVRVECSGRKLRDMYVGKWQYATDTSPDAFPYDQVAHYKRVQYGKATTGTPPYVVWLTTPCRKCDECRKARKRLWARRAFVEMTRAPRTWLITLTLTPAWHAHIASLCRAHYGRAFVRTYSKPFAAHCLAWVRNMDKDPWDGLSYLEQFAQRNVMAGKEITKMFKRWRKEGNNFRYFMVVEPHLGERSETGEPGENYGMPHYHILLHEQGQPMRKRMLEASWPCGFVGAKLVADDEQGKAVWYLVGYLAKTLASRVRASVRYGQEGIYSLTSSEQK